MRRGMLFAPLAAFALGGCAQLFGIDNTTGAAQGSGVSLAVERVSIGASVAKNPQDLSAEMASFLTGDATTGLQRNTAVVAGPGLWTADIADGTPPALFTLPDAKTHLLALPSRAMKINDGVLEHENATAPSPDSQVALNVTLPAPYTTESFDVYAVGAWMVHPLSAAELPAMMATTLTPTIPYATFSPATSEVTPARITASDIVLVLSYLGADLTGVLQATPFDQTDGTDTIAGTMVAVAHDKMLAIPLPSNLGMRYAGVRPAVGAASLSWNIAAAPGATVGVAFGPQLLAGTPAAMDTMVTASYGNPFESLAWPAVFTMTSAATRTFMLNMMPVTLAASLSTSVPADATAAPFDAGLPNTILVGTTQLNSDGISLPIDLTKPVEVTFLSDQSVNTLYTATVIELVPNSAMTGYDRKVVVTATATEAKFDFPPDLFMSGHTYVINAGCAQGGYPMAATGDLQTFSLPISYGTTDSGVFTIQ